MSKIVLIDFLYFQFEAYSLEKIGRNVKEAAKLLEEM